MRGYKIPTKKPRGEIMNIFDLVNNFFEEDKKK